jgi:membrane protein implicated in regulation of membrane protease activity
MTRRLSWGIPDTPPPKHPYRDTFLVYAGFAVVLVVVAWLTGGGVKRAAGVAVVFFVVATAWTSYRFRGKLREQRAQEER